MSSANRIQAASANMLDGMSALTPCNQCLRLSLESGGLECCRVVPTCSNHFVVDHASLAN
eukprot:6194712-Amphidinium_carterae.1